jgi:hypothetical protein
MARGSAATARAALPGLRAVRFFLSNGSILLALSQRTLHTAQDNLRIGQHGVIGNDANLQ